jgi:hypothetical protein
VGDPKLYLASKSGDSTSLSSGIVSFLDLEVVPESEYA